MAVVHVRGSSGSVLPTPLPRTQLIPPEGGGTLTLPTIPQAQGPTVVPGLRNPVPNLPHGPETFQDRASRCATQSGLSGVPNGAAQRYIGGCVQWALPHKSHLKTWAARRRLPACADI